MARFYIGGFVSDEETCGYCSEACGLPNCPTKQPDFVKMNKKIFGDVPITTEERELLEELKKEKK